MKSRLPVLLLLSAALSVAAALPSRAGDTGRTLLTEIMNKPGSWDQMCMIGPAQLFNAPVPLFSHELVNRHFNLGEKEILRLQAARAEVVPALVEFLKAMDLTKPPQETRGKDRGEFPYSTAGMRPAWLNPLHLQIIAELNAVETLPELLRLEAQLHTLLEAVEKDPQAPLPPLDLDVFPFFTKAAVPAPGPFFIPAKPEVHGPRDAEIFTCRVLQRELLGTATLLLRQEQWPAITERFGPALKNDLETKLAQARKELAGAKTKSPAEAPAPAADGAVLELTDTIQATWQVERYETELKDFNAGKPVRFTSAWSPALRTEIRTLTETFLKTVPPEIRRGAAGMPKIEK